MRNFKHLTKTDRIKIEAYLKEKKGPTEIARLLGVSHSTISRELRRGRYTHMKTDLTTEERYSPDIAHARYRENLKAKGAPLKIGNDHELAQYIEGKIADEKYSPDAVIGEIRANGLQFQTTICTTTLYSYIDKDIFLRLTNKNLPLKGKRKRKYRHVGPSRPPRGKSIEKRPPEVDTRETFGHWELDTVISAGRSKETLLVLTERQTRKEIIELIPDRTAASVIKVLDRLERSYGSLFPQIFKTITCDNGSEFSDADGIERKSGQPEEKRTDLYFCHPYSSYERGSNENQNRLIRRHYPKGTNFAGLTADAVKGVESWINKYPRRIFGYLSSDRLFTEQIGALSPT